MNEPTRRTAVVTGGASGIGFALAGRFLTDGMDLAVGDVEEAALADAVERLRARAGGARVLGVRTDVTSSADVAALFEAVEAELGPPAVVCANAGVETGGRFLGVADEAWRWVMDVNYFGTLNTVRAALPRLDAAGGGSLVITGSLAGFASGTPFMTPYCTSKMAVHGLAECLEIELRAAGSPVRVHLLAPGPVRSRMIDAERNAPAGIPIDEDPERRRAMEEFRSRQSAEGLPPEDVADEVAHAVADGRFFVLPHRDRAVAAIERRLDWIRTGAAPTSRVAGS
jgi:NAD(P)-dependent dehydrogenase (short-subunit alcohol dehydrogenase family)